MGGIAPTLRPRPAIDILPASTLATVTSTTSPYSFAPTLSLTTGKAGGTWTTTIRRASDNGAVSVTGSTTTTPTATLTAAVSGDGEGFLWTSTYTDPDGLTGSVSGIVWVAGAAGIDWTTQDLSTFTLTDSLTLLDSASWGTSSTLTIGTGTQGEMDAGRDGVFLVKTLSAGITWSDYAGLLVRITATSFGGVGSGTQANVRVGAVSTTDPATANGILAGIQIQSGGNRFASASAIGVGVGVGITNLGTVTIFDVFVPFTDVGHIGATAQAKGSSAADLKGASSAQTVSDLILAIAFGTGGSPTGTITHSDVVVQTALVNAP